MWKADREKERAKKGGPASEASSSTQSWQLSPRRRSLWCAIHGKLAEHIEAPNMRAGGSRPQATEMQDACATSSRFSASESQTMTNAPPETCSLVLANKGTFTLSGGTRDARTGSDAPDVEAKTMVDEPLDFYVKATGKDGAQMRQELVNMRPGPCGDVESDGKRAEATQRFQDKKQHTWEWGGLETKRKRGVREGV